MKFSTTTLFALVAASVSTSYAKPSVHSHSLRSLKKSEENDKDIVISRECELEIDTGSEVEFKCKSKDKSDLLKTKDQIKYKCSYDEKGLKIKIKYEQEVKTEAPESTNDSENMTMDGDNARRLADQKQTTETEYEVVFDRLVEYAKPDGVVPTTAAEEAYNFDQDSTINSIDLTKMAPFSKVQMEPSGEIKFQISTIDNVATFFFTISPGGDGAAVTANKMKIDVDIKGYQWQQRASNMAVLANVESGTEVDIDYKDDAGPVVQPASVAVRFGTSNIDTTMLRPFGEFTWASNAVVYSVDNSTDVTDTPIMVSPAQASDITTPTNETAVGVASTTIQVVATSASDGSNTMAFSFVGPGAQMAEEIFWDPEAGIGYAPSSAAFGYGFAGMCGIMLAVVYGTF